MSLINHKFLNTIVEKYNLLNLLEVIKNRNDRCALERIMGVIFYIETKNNNTLFGNINKSHKYSSNADFKYNDYIKLFNDKKIQSPFIKVWTGR